MNRDDAASALWDRRLSRWLVRPLVKTWIRPNHLTAGTMLTALAAGWLYARGGGAVHWGAGLFVLSLLLDHADGELARMSNRVSRFGHYFDMLAGAVTYVALFVGMGVAVRDSQLGVWAVPMGLVTGLAVAVIFAVRVGLERRAGPAAVVQPRWGGFEVEDVMYLVGPITWLGALVPFLAAATVGAPLFLLWQIWDGRRANQSGPAP